MHSTMRAAQRLTRGQYINKHLPSLLYPSLFGSSFETKSSLDAASHNYATADGPSARSPFGGMKTHFGFQEVDAAEKSGRVKEVFSNVASSYDLMNDLMSAGVHRLWKNRLVSQLSPFGGMKHVDVAGGTGDIAFRILKAIRQAEAEANSSGFPVAEPGSVIIADINAAMLAEGRLAAAQQGIANDSGLHWLEADAEKMPCRSESVDAYTIAFGIRNVTDIPAALLEAHRVLRKGGRFLCLEFSQVTVPGLRDLYESYSFNVIPKIGRYVANDEESYQYLVESIRQFPPQEEFAGMIEDAGFASVTFENLTAGVAAIHSGIKL